MTRIANPVPSTPQYNSDPRIGVHRTHRSDGAERREPDRHGTREQRAEDHRGEDADQPVGGRDRRTGSERPQDGAVLVCRAQLAGNGLQAEDQADEASDNPEHPERDRLGLDESSICSTMLGVAWNS